MNSEFKELEELKKQIEDLSFENEVLKKQNDFMKKNISRMQSCCNSGQTESKKSSFVKRLKNKIRRVLNKE